MQSDISARKFLAALILITGIAAGIRAVHLTTPSFGNGEVWTIRNCLRDSRLYTRVLSRVPPRASYRLAGVQIDSLQSEDSSHWRKAGITHLNSRLPYYLLGVACVPILGWLAAGLWNRRAAIFVSLFLALSPWHIELSQTARYLMPLFLFYTIALLLYFLGLRRDSTSLLLAAMLAAIAATCTQPIGLTVFGVIFASAILSRATRGDVLSGRHWALVLGAFGVCVALIVVDFTTNLDAAARPLSQLPLGFSTRLLIPRILYKVGALSALAIPLLPWLWQRDRHLTMFFVLSIVLPSAALVAFVVVVYVDVRYFFPTLFAWLVLAAIAADEMYNRTVACLGRCGAITPVAVVCFSFLMGDYLYLEDGHGYRWRYADAVNYVRSHCGSADRIYSTELQDAQYYAQDLPVLPAPRNADEWLQVGRNSWMIADRRAGTEAQKRQSWLEQHADLKAVFGSSGDPQLRVDVYFY